MIEALTMKTLACLRWRDFRSVGESNSRPFWKSHAIPRDVRDLKTLLAVMSDPMGSTPTRRRDLRAAYVVYLYVGVDKGA